jgi:rhombotail lipoprotein
MQTRSLSALLLLGSLLLSGCFGLRHYDVASRSSLVEFLYPDTANPIAAPGIPQLELPLRVGVAFTPAQLTANTGLSAASRNDLAQEVVREFEALDFIDTIQIIPSDYLRQRGSFNNLDQLGSLFGIDVVVLLSYDQSTFTSEGLASLTYWTIVGAYIVPGERNDTQTLIDAAVYDIDSRMLLFRAPGTSVVKSRSALVGNSAQMREDSIRGFDEAGVQLKQNLATELESFKQRVKEAPQNYAVTTREGYTGSGSNEGIFLLAVVLGLCLLKRIGK